ncbi:MAG: hypothetical protein AAGI66_08370 [Cyanobacteria bacterium P01_H01_bin.74]
MLNTTSLKKLFFRSSNGSIVALFSVLSVALIGFLGVTIFSGIQAFIQQELQRVTMNAAMAGASVYYGSTDPRGKPLASPGLARNTATRLFNTLVIGSSLRNFAPVPTVRNNDANDSITVSAEALIDTSLLALIGIRAINITAESTARALKYEPTLFIDDIEILPDGVNIGTYSRVIDLAFPMVDGLGNDLYIEQLNNAQQGYIVEACNQRNCYNLIAGARAVGSGRIRNVGNGEQAIYGSAIIDLAQANVNKATKLRITHSNNFNVYSSGNLWEPPNGLPVPLVINRIMIFGYAGACARRNQCAIPAGFSAVE